MTNENEAPYRIGDRIPETHLPAVDQEGVTPIRGGPRESVALVFPHARCAECRAYVERLARAGESFHRWDARLTVVLPKDEDGAFWSGLTGASLVRDEDDRIRPRLDDAGGAGVVVADRWGAVYEVVRAGEGHALPSAHELVEWLRFIATQCPECGVPDTPGLRTWT